MYIRCNEKAEKNSERYSRSDFLLDTDDGTCWIKATEMCSAAA